ncbi:hypothetical protein V7128_01780 [Neobacillus vireti]|uniref:hypothetical protein n=1 Tax=Neobacillus vireti TaxID=220686 RepID=UPI002FFE48A1
MKKYTLAALQMAYLGAKLEKETEGKRCPLCYEKHCDHNVDVKNDPFLSLTTVSEFQYA